jgi:hypothetical protein
MKKVDLNQYVQLRTMLDSLQIGALRYFVDPDDPYEQEQHFEYLYKHLMPVIQHLWASPKEVDCPDGYYDCNGCCVPYQCIGGFDQ